MPFWPFSLLRHMYLANPLTAFVQSFFLSRNLSELSGRDEHQRVITNFEIYLHHGLFAKLESCSCFALQHTLYIYL